MINKIGRKKEFNSLISMITDKIGRHEVLLPINRNRFNFRKQQIHLGLIYPAETMFKVKSKKNFYILEIPLG